MKKYCVFTIVWNSEKEKIEHTLVGEFDKYVEADKFRYAYERAHSVRCFIDQV